MGPCFLCSWTFSAIVVLEWYSTLESICGFYRLLFTYFSALIRSSPTATRTVRLHLCYTAYLPVRLPGREVYLFSSYRYPAEPMGLTHPYSLRTSPIYVNTLFVSGTRLSNTTPCCPFRILFLVHVSLVIYVSQRHCLMHSGYVLQIITISHGGCP